MKVLASVAGLLGLCSFALGQYSTTVVATGLSSPTGIAARSPQLIYFTEVPQPGVPGGANAVKRMNLASGHITTISMGEPEPVNIALDRSGRPFWTCRSAGVILSTNQHGQVAPFLTGLEQPTGIDIGKDGYVYFTQVPEPAMPMGANQTNRSNGMTIVTLTQGEPEPHDIVVSGNGTTYWTCSSAGVILMRTPAGAVSPLLTGLNQPRGISLDEVRSRLFFTEVPTPGVPGSMGGNNTVNEVNLATGVRTVIAHGDPEPTDIAVATNGTVFWTCTSAGVIMQAKRTN
jgi:hypothetical protein